MLIVINSKRAAASLWHPPAGPSAPLPCPGLLSRAAEMSAVSAVSLESWQGSCSPPFSQGSPFLAAGPLLALPAIHLELWMDPTPPQLPASPFTDERAGI